MDLKVDMKKGGKILFLILLAGHCAFSQQKQPTPQQKAAEQQKSLTQKKGIEELKKMTRKELIDRAVKHINDPEFKAICYDRVKVMANDTKMYVIFDVSVRYVPVLTSYYVPVYVDMVNQAVTIKEVSNSGFFSSIFYDAPKSYEKQIKYVTDAINKSGDTTLLPEKKVTEDLTMNIREVYGHFEVEVESPTKISICKIDKVSAKVTDINHTQLPPKKQNAFTEIKE